MADDVKWVAATTLAEMQALDEDEPMGVEVDGVPLALALVEGEVLAVNDVCTHGRAYLSEGFVEDGMIECPLHQGRFCLRTGEPRTAPVVEAVATYPVRVDGDQVLVGLPA